MGVDFTVEKMPESSGPPSPQPSPTPLHVAAITSTPPRARRDWLDRNLIPILLFVAAIALVIFAAQAGNAIHGGAELNLEDEDPARVVPILADLPQETLLESPMVVFGALIKLASALATLGLIVWWFADRRGLAKTLDIFPTAKPRWMPAVRTLDVAVSWVFGLAAAGALMLVAIPRQGLSSGESHALQIAYGSLGLLSGAAALCALAMWRGGGWHGMAGLFPFWTLPEKARQRSLWQDVALGILVYVLVNAALLAAGGLNKVAVDFFGTPPDQHPLIGDLLQTQPLWVTITIFIAATFGAAFTEELVFRGGLYNACLRYMGAFWAAILASAIFSAVHVIKSDALPLFVLGLAMTWLYHRTGRLVASMTFHFVNNAISLLTIISLRDLIK